MKARLPTPRSVRDVADAVDHKQQVAGRNAQEEPDAVQQKQELLQVQQPCHQEDAHHDAQVQRRRGDRERRRDDWGQIGE